jgi:hypothetical protein
MKALISGAGVLLALAAMADVQAASRGSCSVTHRDCYPACVQMKMTPDGEDCAKTTQVCREICGPEPSYPTVSNTERVDVMRFETMKPLSDPDADAQLQQYNPPE